MSNLDAENLVSVYKSDNPAIVALVKSILDEANIQYMAKDDDVANIIPTNVFPVDFQVLPENVEYARELLKDINPNGSDDPVDPNDTGEESAA